VAAGANNGVDHVAAGTKETVPYLKVTLREGDLLCLDNKGASFATTASTWLGPKVGGSSSDMAAYKDVPKIFISSKHNERRG